MMKKDNQSEAEILRKKAEVELQQRKDEACLVSKDLVSKDLVSKDLASTTEIEMPRLIHELEVHQVELELQNDELQRARVAAEVATNKYTDLYEFASSGYFTLSTTSEIIEINITGTQMLGKLP